MALAILVGLSLAGCGSEGAAPVEPPVPLPPTVLATTPAPRATGVVYDSDITVVFAQDMDASTINATNVFLKVDTQRFPISLAWDAPSRRLRIIPQNPLTLRRTFTVELQPGLLTKEGTSFGPNGWFFQFTTNSARRPTTARPLTGATQESPFVMFSWDSTEISVGNIRYEIWAATDSNSIANRIGTPVTTLTKSRWLPTAAWPLGAAIYWAITVINDATGERLNGVVQRFDTLPLGTPEDSLSIPASDAGYNYIITSVSTVNPYQYCVVESLQCQINTQCWFYFPVSALPADVKVASARIELATYNHYLARLATTPIFMWSSRQTWTLPCHGTANYPDQLPADDQQMATDVPIGDRWMRFTSPLLASHVEASVRRGGFYGYQFHSALRFSFVGPRSPEVTYRPVLKIHYFRTSPAPLAAVTP